MRRLDIKEVLKKHNSELMEIPGVAGIGQGESKGVPCIRVFVMGNKSEFSKSIPKTLDGFPIEIEEDGEFQALDSQQFP